MYLYYPSDSTFLFVFSLFHVNMCMFVTHFIVAFFVDVSLFLFFFIFVVLSRIRIELSVFDSAVSDIAL